MALYAENILFDLDGTLTDPKEGITRSVQYALSKLGIYADTEELVRFIGPPLVESFATFFSLSPSDCELAVKYYRERFSQVGIFENAVLTAYRRCWKSLCQPVPRLRWRPQSRLCLPKGYWNAIRFPAFSP